MFFWFGDCRTEEAPGGDCFKRWFGGDAAFDRDVAARFGGAIERAGAGAFDGWMVTPRGRLALIILLDQLPRNAFRGSAKAYAFDRRAVRVCIDGLTRGDDRGLALTERLFFYLPLLHSERWSDQRRSVECFRQLATNSGDGGCWAARWVDVARRCRLVIGVFRRFPHRNDVLGRRSSLAELVFLAANRMRGRFVRRVRGAPKGC